MGGCPETKEERRDTESSPALIRIASAYRSVSTEALQVLTGVLPVDIQAEGRALLRRQCISRDQLKERQLQEWQTRWETTGKGSWTRQLLPRIAEWTGRNHGELEYYITQALTGHGCFAAFLNKIGKENSPKCWYCDAEVDDAGHILFRCERWDYERSGHEKHDGKANERKLRGHSSVVERGLGSYRQVRQQDSQS
jgi:hypothetical protein